MDDIVKKIIMPRARGFSRIEGSKKTAVDFIVGETRQGFQDNLEQHLRETCEPWGVAVHSVLIRNIIAPEDIAKVIRDRELAVQEARKFEQQTEQAKSKAELVHQEMLAEQNSKKVEAETAKLKAEIATKQEQSVQLIAAKREKEVAAIGREAAVNQAAALLLEAEAAQAVIRKTNEAEAGVLSTRTTAFGSGAAFARFAVYDKLAPKLKALLTTDGQAGFGLPLPAAGTSVPVKAKPGTEVSK
jgi:regulator of protease activity HflC (stomatin/prohibitin superfamily)